MYYQRYNNNKYKNIKQEYSGSRFDSKKEANKAYELDMLKRAKEIKGWQKQVKIEFNFKKTDNGWVLTDETKMELKEKGMEFRHLFNYFIDFVVFHNDGSEEYIECKGLFVEPGKTKVKLLDIILEDHPTKYFTLEK